MNSNKHSVTVLKRQFFQDKHHVGTFANIVLRSVKTMMFNALPKTPEDIWLEFDSSTLRET